MAGETGLGELGHLLWLIHSKTCLYCHLEFVFHVWYGWPNRISFISTETMHGGLHPPTALTSILKLRHILTQHIHGKSINHLSLGKVLHYMESPAAEYAQLGQCQPLSAMLRGRGGGGGDHYR